jgi:SAM-dependent methyltransferase
MAVAQFTREYRTVRRAEGWGSSEGEYYRALPYRDLTRRFDGIWAIRARSFETFLSQVLLPLERSASPRTLQLLDLGAGCGWLSYRLALRGHSVVAVDLLDDQFDGLGARVHYDRPISAVQAEFDRLPLQAASAEVVVFNASLHYSTSYVITLREALRVLSKDGTLVILDSPMYVDPTSGERMVREREARFQAAYGFASNALPSEHFLSTARLKTLGEQLGLTWQMYQPTLPWRTAVSRRFNGLRARREAARFPVIVGRRQRSSV